MVLVLLHYCGCKARASESNQACLNCRAQPRLANLFAKLPRYLYTTKFRSSIWGDFDEEFIENAHARLLENSDSPLLSLNRIFQQQFLQRSVNNFFSSKSRVATGWHLGGDFRRVITHLKDLFQQGFPAIWVATPSFTTKKETRILIGADET